MKVITTEKKPIKMWLENIEEGALQQAKNLANLPFTVGHVAIMPDSHQGYGMPIGGVLATRDVIIPNAVGVDIGCGMNAIKSNLKDVDISILKEWIGKMRKAIPVGFSHHSNKQEWEGFSKAPDIPIIQKELESAKYQLGTLGGGNHFIELQKDKDGYLWVMLHSGSRNFGFKTAHEYHLKALALCEKWQSDIPDKELSFLPLDSKEGQEYIVAMNYCLDFAFASRKLMLNRVIDIIGSTHFTEASVNIHHNFATMENHFGKNVMVHRKGATQAKEGQIGIIPGSQGTESYIVKGKGNKNSMESCSHGAGRRMGRKQAQRELNLEQEVKKLNDQGILHAIRGINDLDEASGAYKDVKDVMKNQSDLVDILIELKPLAVIKG